MACFIQSKHAAKMYMIPHSTLFLRASMTECLSGFFALSTLSNCKTCFGAGVGWLTMSSSTWTEKVGF